MFEYKVINKDGKSRTGVFSTPHGNIETPIFMPVGTKATVKGITREELDEMGAQIILANTYHMYLTMGDETVKEFGGLHNLMNVKLPILTDSGGFQVFSMGEAGLAKITEEGVHFRSHIDGSKHFFTPEKAMDIQSNLGADIIMAFDECAAGESTHEYAIGAMERTHRWLKRCETRVEENNKKRLEEGLHEQALFGIVQGVIYDDLRVKSAKFVSEINTPGIAIGGLSVGESKEDMMRTLDVTVPHLPENKPRYLMGVGTPEDLVEGIYRGVDMFDCVLPTRLGRHGVAFGTHGKIRIKNKIYEKDKSPLDSQCNCKVCQNYTKGYLRHLYRENEMLGLSMLSYHNLYFLLELTGKAKKAINAGEYEEFRKDFWEKLGEKPVKY
ncbi:MAG: tRNA guanosine(34) transglycosylase Tgt [Candidatus Gracilibacteria bacterium]|nr:tRNA guanosine(34) transglycosylase Tgt [Candidatus Gracilibacteria bacterium]